MRTTGPWTVSPPGSVTVAVTARGSGVGGPGAAAPRPPRRPPPAEVPVTQVFCSALPSGTLVPMPCRSPVGEWQLLHFALK